MRSIVTLIREGVLDPELAALLWLLAGSGVPVHVTSEDAEVARTTAAGLSPLSSRSDGVSYGAGGMLEEVLRQPVPLRPATGAVVIVREGRVVAAHFHRPPLRDAGGHVRPQGPAVLATWDPAREAWEHFAWGVIPELAAAAGHRPGDFEIEHGRRREYLAALAGSRLAGAEIVAALAGYAVATPPQ